MGPVDVDGGAGTGFVVQGSQLHEKSGRLQLMPSRPGSATPTHVAEAEAARRATGVSPGRCVGRGVPEADVDVSSWFAVALPGQPCTQLARLVATPADPQAVRDALRKGL